MDISKASNFERFAFDLVGRDPAVVRALWAKVDAGERPERAAGSLVPGSCALAVGLRPRPWARRA
jgi:hypothetical protein